MDKTYALAVKIYRILAEDYSKNFPLEELAQTLFPEAAKKTPCETDAKRQSEVLQALTFLENLNMIVLNPHTGCCYAKIEFIRRNG